jgi:hypothetical protein
MAAAMKGPQRNPIQRVCQRIFMSPLTRLWCAWVEEPTVTSLPLVMIPIGVEALVLGGHASKAFDNLGGALLVRVLGAALLVGGLVVAAGIIRRDPALEPIGLAIATVGSVLYGGGVILGLGSQGLIAGQFAIGMAIGFLGRIRKVIREAPGP